MLTSYSEWDIQQSRAQPLILRIHYIMAHSFISVIALPSSQLSSWRHFSPVNGTDTERNSALLYNMFSALLVCGSVLLRKANCQRGRHRSKFIGEFTRHDVETTREWWLMENSSQTEAAKEEDWRMTDTSHFGVSTRQSKAHDASFVWLKGHY